MDLHVTFDFIFPLLVSSALLLFFFPSLPIFGLDTNFFFPD